MRVVCQAPASGRCYTSRMSETFEPSVAPPSSPAPHTMWLIGGNEGLAVHVEGEQVRLPSEAEATALGATREGALYLGRRGDTDVWASEPAKGAALPAGFELRNLRTLWGPLDDATWSIAGRATQLVEWDRTHRFCGRCATPTTRASDERVRRCPACELSAYPRVAPAVIVLVERPGEVLLARAANFRGGFYSTLAGFVEAGESLEETVAREIFEEVGVRVGELRYFGSQPWPFPHSLMVGFRARWLSGEIRIDAKEIADAQWFRPDAMPKIPPPLSIARRLIDSFLGEQGRELRSPFRM